MKVLAEGVETEGQLNLLIANGCDMIQGFFFSEPVAPAQIEQMLRDDRRLPERFLTRSQRKRTLLLVDDEQNIVSSLRRLFRRDGYDIVTANSGAEGLQRLAEVNIDVIVSDQRMPGMTGVEFLRRAKELYPDTVRMVLSGYTELQSITDAVNEGAIYKFPTKRRAAARPPARRAGVHRRPRSGTAGRTGCGRAGSRRRR
jgi:CheY-like chemotaxis protein